MMSLDNQFSSHSLLIYFVVFPSFCPSPERQVLPDDLRKSEPFRSSLQSVDLFQRKNMHDRRWNRRLSMYVQLFHRQIRSKQNTNETGENVIRLQVCASNGMIYRNLCEMERERCVNENNIVAVDQSYCK